MARITVEDCLDRERNRFALVRLAARRAKQLLSGEQPVTDTKGNRAVVSALREIADGKVRFLPSSEHPVEEEDSLHTQNGNH
jgi:DNA-directed RNA polymerase subunit omega